MDFLANPISLDIVKHLLGLGDSAPGWQQLMESLEKRFHIATWLLKLQSWIHTGIFQITTVVNLT